MKTVNQSRLHVCFSVFLLVPVQACFTFLMVLVAMAVSYIKWVLDGLTRVHVYSERRSKSDLIDNIYFKTF